MNYRVCLFVLLAVVVAAMPAAASTVLGQTALNSARVDGALVPEGTTLLSPSKIETGAYPATVHLATGQTLNLGPNSTARLAAAAEGGISLATEAGNVTVGTESGEVFKLAANTVARLSEDEAGSGEAVVMIDVCDDSDRLIKWDAADIDNCEGCYLPNDEGECKGKPAGWAGLGKGAVIGLSVGAAVLGYAIADDDNTTSTDTVLCGVPDASGNVPPGTNPPGVGGCP